ncbi:MAG: FtsX-like permease family protein, partial [Candidatus Thorarchaeota archaeon]
QIYMHTPICGQPEVTYLQMITTPEGIESLFNILPPDEYEGLTDRIWVRFDKQAITEIDPQIMIESLDSARKQIEQATLPYAVIGYNNFRLIDAVYEYAIWSINVRAIALAFSLPSIIMGIMLIQYNSKLLSDEQRRDVGTIKTRGASGIQAFSWVLSSAVATGFVGSIGAIVTGIVSAILSGSVRELLVFQFDQLEGFALLLQPVAVITVFLFSFSAGIIIALPGAIKALIMTPTEAHGILEGEILTQSEKMGNPAIDLLAVGVTAWLLIPMLGFFAYYGVSAFGFIIVPLFAVFLFAFTRIASRPTSIIKSKILSRIRKPSLVVGSRVMSRSIVMFKKSEAMGTMFIAMVFCAGLFASLSATTGDAHMKHVFQFQTGADIIADVDAILSNVTTDLVDNITAVEGVVRVSPMLRTTGYVQYYDAYYFGGGENVNRSISIYGVQSDTWASTAFFLDYFTLYDTPGNSIQRLSQYSEESANIITSFKPISHYLVDEFTFTSRPVYSDSLDLQVFTSGGFNETGWYNETECTIIDVMISTLEQTGLRRTYFPGESDAQDFLIMDLNLLHSWINSTEVTKFYIDLAPGANYTQALIDIYNIAPDSFTNVESAYEYIDAVLDSRAAQSIYGAYTLNVIFSLIYLTIGMTIVTSVRVRGLRKQLSVLRALGTESKSMIVAALADTTISLILAALIGGVIGIGLSYLVQNIPLLYMGNTTSQLWSRLPVMLIIPWPLIIMILGIAVTVSLAATYIVLVRTLNLNIAEEIQYTE